MSNNSKQTFSPIAHATLSILISWAFYILFFIHYAEDIFDKGPPQATIPGGEVILQLFLLLIAIVLGIFYLVQFLIVRKRQEFTIHNFLLFLPLCLIIPFAISLVLPIANGMITLIFCAFNISICAFFHYALISNKKKLLPIGTIGFFGLLFISLTFFIYAMAKDNCGRNGHFVEYYDNGEKAVEYDLACEEFIGEYRLWHRNGQFAQYKYYSSPRRYFPADSSIYYDESGNRKTIQVNFDSAGKFYQRELHFYPRRNYIQTFKLNERKGKGYLLEYDTLGNMIKETQYGERGQRIPEEIIIKPN